MVPTTPLVYLSCGRSDETRPVVDRIAALLGEEGLDVDEIAGGPAAPGAERERILSADAVAVVLTGDPEIPRAVVREVGFAREAEVPVFAVVDRRLVGTGYLATEVGAMVSGGHSFARWHEYDRHDLLHNADQGPLRAMLRAVRDRLLSRSDEARARRQAVAAAFDTVANQGLPDALAYDALYSHGHSLESFLEKLAEVAAATTGAEIGIVAKARRRASELRVDVAGFWSRLPAAEGGAAAWRDLLTQPFHASPTGEHHGILSRVMATGQPFRHGRLQREKAEGTPIGRMFVDPGGLRIESEAAVPVFDSTGEVALVIDVEHAAPDRFRPFHLPRLATLALVASGIYERMRLQDYCGRVVALAREAQGGTSREEAARRVLEFLMEVGRAEWGFIAFRDAPGAPMRVQAIAAEGLRPEQGRAFAGGALRVQEMVGITGLALTREEVVAVPDIAVHRGPYLDWFPGARAEIVVPICDHARGAEGILDLEFARPRPFSPQYVKAVDFLAKMLLVAVPAAAHPGGSGGPVGADSVRQLLAQGEGSQLAFVPSWGAEHEGEDLRHDVARRVCAFLNRSGGTVLLGVSPEGEVLGLGLEVETDGEREAFERAVLDHLAGVLEPAAAGDLVVPFWGRAGDHAVFGLEVRRSGVPCYCRNLRGQRALYVRVGPRTVELDPADAVAYCANRWPRRTG